MEVYTTVDRKASQAKNSQVFWSEVSVSQQKAEVIYNLACIKNSLEFLLSTSIGERFFNPTFGCGVSGGLFNLMTTQEVLTLKDNITRSIKKWEPRIDIDSNMTEIRANPDLGYVDVKLSFKVQGDSSYTNYEYSLRI